MSAATGIGLSLLDHLMSEERPPVTRIRDGLRRDLQDLLNANERVIGWAGDLPELDSTILNYGIIDLTSANLSTEELRTAIVERIGDAIRRHEPRLTDVRLSTLSSMDSSDRTLRIRITAQIRVEAELQPFILNTVIDPLSNSVSLMRTPT